MSRATEAAIAEIRASKPLAKHVDQILALVRPQLRFEPRTGTAADNELGASRLGGEPDLPAGTAWPIDGDAPMDFMAQIDLDAVARRDVDRVLPRSGVLAFFLAQSYDACAVIHGEHDAIARVATPDRRTAKPPKWGGFDVTADLALPPPFSQLVSPSNRSASAWNPRTNERGAGPTVVELSPQAHAAYDDIYERWVEAVGYHQHGMLGYERALESVQQRDELLLLRIDFHDFSSYDFSELVSIYWFITEDNLAARRFDRVDVCCGGTI